MYQLGSPKEKVGNVDQDHLRRASNDRPTVQGTSLPVYPRVCPVEGQGIQNPRRNMAYFSGDSIPLKTWEENL